MKIYQHVFYTLTHPIRLREFVSRANKRLSLVGVINSHQSGAFLMSRGLAVPNPSVSPLPGSGQA